MHGPQRRFLTPVFLITALLLTGRYVGEERIAARWRPRPVRALRPQHLEGSFAVRGQPAALAPAA